MFEIINEFINSINPLLFNAIISLTSAIVIGFLVTWRINRKLEKLKFIFPHKFNDNKKYLQMLRQTKDLVFNFYYRNPNLILFQYKIAPDMFMKNYKKYVDESELFIFELNLSDRQDPFYCLYDAKTSTSKMNELHNSFDETWKKFYFETRLVDSTIKQKGEELINYLFSIRRSPEHIRIINKLKNHEIPTNEKYEMYSDFWKNQMKIYQETYDEIRNRFDKLYNLI